MRHGGLILALVWLALAPAGHAQDQYVRDEIRINLREGPGDGYSAIQLLVSGDPVAPIIERNGWVKVRTGEGVEGWLPKSYLSDSPPPSLALPKLEAQLARTRKRVEELENELAAKAQALQETEALRERNATLEEENSARQARWRTLTIGGAIALAGVLLGLLLPRVAPPARGRRIKL